MTNRLNITGAAAVIVGLMFAHTASATPININFGATVNNASTNTPGQVFGGITGTTWNLVTDDTTLTTDADGNPINLTLSLGKETANTTNIMDWNATGYSNSALGTAPTLNGTVFKGSNAQSGTFVNDGGGSAKALGVRISGLAAGTYDIYVVSRNTNAGTHGSAISFTAIDSSSGSLLDYNALSTTSLSNSAGGSANWDQGHNFAKATVTLGADQDLVVISQGTSTSQLRGFFNTIQIIPEPTSITLITTAGLFLLRRRQTKRA